jgi:hypothetical protein
MTKPKAPCGTDAAYRRHLREAVEPDEACKAAHADARRADRRSRQAPVPAADRLVQVREESRARYLKTVSRLAAAVRDDDLQRVIDLAADLDALLDDWCEAHSSSRRGKSF